MAYEFLTQKHLERLKVAIKDELAAKNLDNTGEASLSLEVKGNELLGFEYIYYLVNGRGPGKFPPVQNIRDWVRQKLGITDKEANGIAYVVGRKISREGTSIYKNKSKGLQLDELVSTMMDELTKELPDYAAAEALKWL